MNSGYSKKNQPRVGAVIVAAGKGTRMGNVAKPLISLGGKTVIERVVAAFTAAPSVDEIVLVCGDPRDFAGIIRTTKPLSYAAGGRTRSDSVANGIKTLKNAAYICVHDAARPFISPEDIEKIIKKALETGAAAAFTKVKDTIKYRSVRENCLYTPKRENLLAVGTPQVFARDIYFASKAKALCAKSAFLENPPSESIFTDETALLENAGFQVDYVETTSNNLKLTDAKDVKIAKAICFLEETRPENPAPEGQRRD